MDRNHVIKVFKEQWLAKAGEYTHTPERIQKLIPEVKVIWFCVSRASGSRKKCDPRKDISCDSDSWKRR